MSTQLQTRQQPENAGVILRPDADKDSRYRLGKFARWLDKAEVSWYAPDLAGYRDHLADLGLAPATISAHLSTVRGRYAELLLDRPRFFALAADQAGDFVSRKATVDELITRIENAMDPRAAKVTVPTKQDVADSEHLRLSKKQAEALMAAPGVDTLAGLRDTAVLSLLLCTGLREQELSSLDVDDLRQTSKGKLCLRVRKGKGAKQRLIPYGELSWCLTIVDAWLARAGIQDGPVFRGLYKGGQRLRPGRLSVRAIQYILGRYPVVVDGRLVTARPHDLRRTYAARLYGARVGLLEIQQNLGHADDKTTLGYIGDLSIEKREPPAIYSFDVGGLAQPRLL